MKSELRIAYLKSKSNGAYFIWLYNVMGFEIR